MMKYTLIGFLFFCLCGNLMTAQELPENIDAINNYKYIIVPVKYDLMNDADKYQLNSLTKFLFNKYGYEAYLENDSFPDDLKLNRCLALTADFVKVKGGFLGTRVKFNLIDCKQNIVVSSRVGKSRQKEFKKAYNLSLRDAFVTFQNFPYKYKPDPNLKLVTAKPMDASSEKSEAERQKEKAEIEKLKQEIADLKKDQKVNNTKPKPVIESTEKKEKVIKSSTTLEQSNVLYAQAIDNGFQVVDSVPKVIMILLETPFSDTFLVKGKDAIVYKKDGFWHMVTNDGTSLEVEKINIKF